MCRWLAYSGAPIYLERLIFQSQHSLIAQSRAARLAATTAVNGDGFGVGWYGSRPFPGVYRDVRPAWNDENLRSLAAQIAAPIYLAHVRAATDTAIQRSNCHPFVRDNWLFVHNGIVNGFPRLRRELAYEIAPELCAELRGSTDSEILFLLAWTFGLADEPLPALARMAALVERIGAAHGIEYPLQMTLGLSDGARLFAVRYSTNRVTGTLFHSKSIDDLRRLHPVDDVFSDDARVVVSEPLSAPDDWVEIPESTAIVVDRGRVECMPFEPRVAVGQEVS